MTDTTDIKKGLAGVVVDTTAISKVNPETNSLLYRGYPVQELAAKCSFEQVAWLLWHGELPSDAELASFEKAERAGRALAPHVKAAIDLTPTTAHPMDVVRTAVSMLGAHDPQAEDSSPEAELAKAVRLFAAVPAMVAYDQRRRRGQEVVEPREDLDYSRNFLWMTFGEEPTETEADVFRISMVLYAALGLVGLPVYSDGTHGAGVLFGATGGYIIGFILAAALVGWLAEREWDRKILKALATFAAGSLAVFAVGLPWLAIALHLDLQQTLLAGFYPFIIGGIIKAVVAAGLLPLAWFGADKLAKKSSSSR